ncbi:MAG: hypothetical protein IT378_21570 [Sandaracinaceae bacterium]|nr:hypothetical protein [Sandaracinaceae bacterium]
MTATTIRITGRSAQGVRVGAAMLRDLLDPLVDAVSFPSHQRLRPALELDPATARAEGSDPRAGPGRPSGDW